MEKNIFRQAALERLASPERLDALMQVTQPRAWLALTALMLVLVAGILWGLFATISTRIAAQGIITRSGNVAAIVATVSGQIHLLKLKPGQIVEEGQTIAVLFRWDTDAGAANQVYTVVIPFRGRVLEVIAQQGQVLERGGPLVSLEPVDSTLEAVLYVAPTDGKKVRSGMSVNVAPVTVKPEEFGYIVGKVTSVSTFPRSRQGMQTVLGMKELAERFTKDGPPYEVHVRLLTDQAGASGYKWSSRGPDIPVENGTLCTARIVVRTQSPISLLTPHLKKTFGLYTGPELDDGKPER